MLRSYIRMLLFALGLMVAVQVPGFIKDYQIRVEAHRHEANLALQGFRETADGFFKGDLQALLNHYRDSSDPVFQRDAANIQQLMGRVELFDAQWRALQGAWYQRAWHMFSGANRELLQETWQGYSYQVVLQPEAIGWGLLGGLILACFAEVLMIALGALVGLGETRRRKPPHWD